VSEEFKKLDNIDKHNAGKWHKETKQFNPFRLNRQVFSIYVGTKISSYFH